MIEYDSKEFKIIFLGNFSKTVKPHRGEIFGIDVPGFSKNGGRMASSFATLSSCGLRTYENIGRRFRK